MKPDPSCYSASSYSIPSAPSAALFRLLSTPFAPKKAEKREMFPRIRRGRSIIRTFPQKKERQKEAFLKCDTKIPSLSGKTFFLPRERGGERAASAYPSHYSVVSSCAVFPGCPAKKNTKKFPLSSCLSPSPPLFLLDGKRERERSEEGYNPLAKRRESPPPLLHT